MNAAFWFCPSAGSSVGGVTLSAIVSVPPLFAAPPVSPDPPDPPDPPLSSDPQPAAARAKTARTAGSMRSHLVLERPPATGGVVLSLRSIRLSSCALLAGTTGRPGTARRRLARGVHDRAIGPTQLTN